MVASRQLTDVEMLLLLAVVRLQDGAYAVSIREEIERHGGVSLSRGTVYITLGRLERRGYLESWFADPTPERGGKAKKYFRLMPLGLKALEATRRSLERMWEGVGLPAEKA